MPNALIAARDISLVLLAIEFILLGALPLFILLKITQGLRRLIPKVRPALQRFHERLKAIFAAIDRVALALCKPFSWAQRMRSNVSALLKRS